MNERLSGQLAFIREIERLKTVRRRNKTLDGRFENSAEHSWHVAIIAVLLAEHSDSGGLDLFKVVKMLLIHDLVEIYAGDTWLYDDDGTTDQEARERVSAGKLFALLPPDQEADLRGLWEEFEAGITAESAFAKAADALQPLINHLLVGGSDEVETDLPSKSQVVERKRHIAGASDMLWKLASEIIDESTSKGLYRDH